MSDVDWARAKELLAEALELPESKRLAFVDQLIKRDDTLGREVETLLNAHMSAEGAGFLENPLGPGTDAKDDGTIVGPGSQRHSAYPSAGRGSDLAGPKERPSDESPGETQRVDSDTDGTIDFDPASQPTLDGSTPGAGANFDERGAASHETLQADQVVPPTRGNSIASRSSRHPARSSEEGAPADPQFITDDYEVLDELGVGGMGVVYRAFQHSLRRHVALKIIPTRLMQSSEQVARFYLEAEAAAGLDHPGIVPVQDVGEHDGVHYYAMALVEGGSLADFTKRKDNKQEKTLTPRRAAEIMEQVCRAVQYAHDHAVIHRDIKPANILLDKNGAPRLTDFGLAKVTDEDDGLTVTGQVMGTPSFMAPEQAEGKSHAVSNRTDVYSLGATLYALLAGHAPFRASNVLTTLKKVKDAAPEPLDKKTPLDLRTICEKCLAKLPEQRYASAAAMADDLQRYLQGYPIAARRVSTFQRGVRWCRRNPAIASMLAAVAATLVMATIVSLGFAFEANRQADEAVAAREQAERNAQRLSRMIEETVIFASENVLAEEPGMQTVRQELLQNAQRYYQELVATGQADESRLAAASFMLGRVEASLGRLASARESFQHALALQEKNVAANPQATQPMMALAQTHNEFARLGQATWSNRQIDRPTAEAREGLEIWRRHAQACAKWRGQAVAFSQADPELNRLHANALMNLALAQVEYATLSLGQNEIPTDKTVDSAAIEALLSRSQSIREELLSREQAGSEVRRDFALGLAAMADLRSVEASRAKHPDSADRLRRESLALRNEATEALAGLPSDAITLDTESKLATCHQLAAEAHFELGEVSAAVNSFGRMLTVMQRLLLRNPNVGRFRSGVARAQFNLAQLTYSSGNIDRADAYMADCQDTLAEGVAINVESDSLEQLLEYTLSISQALAEHPDLRQRAMGLIDRAEQLLEENGGSPSNQAPGVESARQRLQASAEALREELAGAPGA